MAKFFFHVDCDGTRTEAEESVELPDIEAACHAAVTAAAEIAADDLRAGRHHVHQVVVVADENRDLVSVKVEAVLEVVRH
jgi:predicted regulator of Ras-like GTPase activity (Roadblock/LC7/MglB family)